MYAKTITLKIVTHGHNHNYSYRRTLGLEHCRCLLLTRKSHKAQFHYSPSKIDMHLSSHPNEALVSIICKPRI